MGNKKTQPKFSLDKLASRVAQWAGTPASVIVHTIFFIGSFVLVLFGVDINRVMLIVTTAVSLEAIYLSLFIQMTVNSHSKHLKDVKEDIEDIQEEIEDLSE